MAKKRTRSKRPWENTFLEGLATCGSVTHAARMAGITRGAVQRYRAKHKDFAEAWQEKLDEYLDSVHMAASDLAINRKNTSMIRYILSRRHPDYVDRTKVELTGPRGGPVQVTTEIKADLPDPATWAEILRVREEQERRRDPDPL